MTEKIIDVVGAVIVKKGQILCAQRNRHGTLPNLWEFPGGKLSKMKQREMRLFVKFKKK